MVRHCLKHCTNMVPGLDSRRCRPIDSIANLDSRNIHCSFICIIRVQSTRQRAQSIRTDFDHAVSGSVIIIVINDLIAGKAAMISSMIQIPWI